MAIRAGRRTRSVASTSRQWSDDVVSRPEDEDGENTADLSAAYASWRASRLGRITDALEHDLLRELIQPVPNAAVLDVGCGDGDLAVDLAERSMNVVGIDASSDMIAKARRRAAGSSVSFAIGGAEALPFATDTFDVVVSVTVLCFIERPADAVREMARVVRPGGVVVIADLGRWSTWAAIRRIKGWRGSSTWCKARFRPASELQKFASAAGLTVVRTRGAVFYPPNRFLARLGRRLDPCIGRLTTFGAAFIAVAASKPAPGNELVRANRRSGDNEPLLERAASIQQRRTRRRHERASGHRDPTPCAVRPA